MALASDAQIDLIHRAAVHLYGGSSDNRIQ